MPDPTAGPMSVLAVKYRYLPPLSNAACSGSRVPAGARCSAVACSAFRQDNRGYGSVVERPGNREVGGSIPFSFSERLAQMGRAQDFQSCCRGFDSCVVAMFVSHEHSPLKRANMTGSRLLPRCSS